MADKEYIEREAAIEIIRLNYCKDCNSYNGVRCRACSFDDAMMAIEDVPTANVVEVVRCEKCKHYETSDWDGEILCGCNHPSGLKDVEPNAHCSYGERKRKE